MREWLYSRNFWMLRMALEVEDYESAAFFYKIVGWLLRTKKPASTV